MSSLTTAAKHSLCSSVLTLSPTSAPVAPWPTSDSGKLLVLHEFEEFDEFVICLCLLQVVPVTVWFLFFAHLNSLFEFKLTGYTVFCLLRQKLLF